ncbi:MAG: CBS domain-containing protein, partial [Rhodospirillales bacterium]|nr:CBS domain-containing protein [Rhodospirillales bacterium]
MTMRQKIIPDIIKDQNIHSLAPDGTVLEAAKLMVNRDVGAIVVTDEGNKLAGIVTERDITRRVIAKGLDPSAVKISEIMTKEPDTVGPDDSAVEALEIMRIRRYRHLPVVD